MTFNHITAYYRTYAQNYEFFTVQVNGYLSPTANYSANNFRNFNFGNFDFSHSWWFASASEIAILYRNYVLERTNLVEKNMSANLSNVFDSKLTTILCVSIRF